MGLFLRKTKDTLSSSSSSSSTTNYPNYPPERIVLLPLPQQLTTPKGSTFRLPVEDTDAAVVQSQPSLGDTNTNTSELPVGVPLLQLYVCFLACCAMAWLVYLLLPRGFKKAYLFPNKKKKQQRQQSNQEKSSSSRSPWNSSNNDAQAAVPDDDSSWFTFTSALATRMNNNNNNSIAGQSNVTGSVSIQDSILAATEARRRRDLATTTTTASGDPHSVWEDIPVDDDDTNNRTPAYYSSRDATTRTTISTLAPFGMAQSDAELENHETPVKSSSTSNNYYSHIPSPHHPQVNPLPAEAVWRECYRRLQGTGMRLTAHGVQCPSVRVCVCVLRGCR